MCMRQGDSGTIGLYLSIKAKLEVYAKLRVATALSSVALAFRILVNVNPCPGREADCDTSGYQSLRSFSLLIY